MEIEAKEWVRLKDGRIRQFKQYNEDIEFIELTRPYSTCKEKDIVKHSKNIIDLIEVGDIVEDEYNKYEVAFVKYDRIYCNDYNLDDSLITLREQDIKAILTREQFEANCYKVGGEDEKI